MIKKPKMKVYKKIIAEWKGYFMNRLIRRVNTKIRTVWLKLSKPVKKKFFSQ